MTAATNESKTPHVLIAMSAVMQEIGQEGISKDHSGPKNQYKFRGIDDVYNALNPIMAKHKLLLVPTKVVPTYNVVPRKDGGSTVYCHAVISFKAISAADGSSVEIETMGEGMDYSDKASNKALSGALKYAALMVFMIPTEGLSDNNEDANPVLDTRGYQQSRQEGPGRPEDDFPGDRPPSRQTVAQRPRERPQYRPRDDQGQGRSQSTGIKSSAQAKKDGDWEMLENTFKAQRTEEELIACAKAQQHVLERLPYKWKEPARELYRYHLDRVRNDDAAKIVDRMDPSRGFNEQTGEVWGDDEDSPWADRRPPA